MSDTFQTTGKRRVWLALRRFQILFIAATGSNITRYLSEDWSQISWWGWFIVVSGLIVVTHALFLPAKDRFNERA